MKVGAGSYAEFLSVPWATGTVTANAKDAAGKTVATDSRHTLGKASKLELSIDAPSAATGTGEAVLLDGHDAALLRASVVDADGRVMVHAQNVRMNVSMSLIASTVCCVAGTENLVSAAAGLLQNISFKVLSGPGFVQGSHNGDVHCHQPNNAPWHT